MDGNLTNSKLLQHILESAETIKKEKGKKILTVNHDDDYNIFSGGFKRWMN